MPRHPLHGGQVHPQVEQVPDPGPAQVVGGGFTECFFVKGETNNLLTPSGYFMFEDNTRFGVTVIGPDFNETQTGTEHLQELVKNDATVKEMHDRSVAVLHFQSGSFVQDCTFSQIFHYANGQIQYDRSNAVCTSP